MARKQFSTIVRHLTEDPTTAVELVKRLDDNVLEHVAAALSDETRRRAIEHGDQQAVLDQAFDHGFGRDGMGVLPFVEGPFVVCPGAMVSKRKGNHTCRFVSVNDCWIWECRELLHEEKRSSPGAFDGFRAVALLPKIEGMELDVVSGRLRSGQHQVDLVVSFVIRKGDLVEVSQRNVKAMRSHTSRAS